MSELLEYPGVWVVDGPPVSNLRIYWVFKNYCSSNDLLIHWKSMFKVKDQAIILERQPACCILDVQHINGGPVPSILPSSLFLTQWILLWSVTPAAWTVTLGLLDMFHNYLWWCSLDWRTDRIRPRWRSQSLSSTSSVGWSAPSASKSYKEIRVKQS